MRDAARLIEQRLVELSGRSDLRVPAYPPVLARITRAVDQPNFSVTELTRIVGSDQALSAGVLRYANSAQVAASAPIASLDRAIMQIGTREVVRCAVAGSLGAAALAAGPLAPLRYKVWREALLAANLAQELASTRGVAPDTAFLAGLLHDFGKIVLLGALDQKPHAQPDPSLPADAWLALIDRFHVEAGLCAAFQWRLPPAVVDTIRGHHGGELTDAVHQPLVDTIVLADRIVELVTRQIAVGEEELRALPGLGTGERTRILAALPRVVGMVASFGSPDRAPSGPFSSWVEPVPSAEATAGKVSFSVTCERRQGLVPFLAHHVDWTTLYVSGRVALAQNYLAKMTLHLPGRDLDVWMNVIECRPGEGGEHEVELRPFALQGEVKSTYHAMVREALGSSAPSAPRAAVGGRRS